MYKGIKLNPLRNVIRQAIELNEGKDFNTVCINDEDPSRLDIRLGGELGFINLIILADGRRVHNMNINSRAAITPTELVELFKPFGANQGPALTHKRIEGILADLN